MVYMLYYIYIYAIIAVGPATHFFLFLVSERPQRALWCSDLAVGRWFTRQRNMAQIGMFRVQL